MPNSELQPKAHNGRRIIKATKKRQDAQINHQSKQVSAQETLVKPQVMNREKAVSALTSMLRVFSASSGHLIVGRDQEEQAIKTFITESIQSDESGLLYVCGHPGQGKTAVINQVLFDHFGDLDSSLGGIADELYILKYNGMRYENSQQFAQTLSQDLARLIDFEFKRKTNLIKTLRSEDGSGKRTTKTKKKVAEKSLYDDEETKDGEAGFIDVEDELTSVIVS